MTRWSVITFFLLSMIDTVRGCLCYPPKKIIHHIYLYTIFFQPAIRLKVFTKDYDCKLLDRVEVHCYSSVNLEPYILRANEIPPIHLMYLIERGIICESKWDKKPSSWLLKSILKGMDDLKLRQKFLWYLACEKLYGSFKILDPNLEELLGDANNARIYKKLIGRKINGIIFEDENDRQLAISLLIELKSFVLAKLVSNSVQKYEMVLNTCFGPDGNSYQFFLNEILQTHNFNLPHSARTTLLLDHGGSTDEAKQSSLDSIAESFYSYYATIYDSQPDELEFSDKFIESLVRSSMDHKGYITSKTLKLIDFLISNILNETISKSVERVLKFAAKYGHWPLYILLRMHYTVLSLDVGVIKMSMEPVKKMSIEPMIDYIMRVFDKKYFTGLIRILIDLPGGKIPLKYTIRQVLLCYPTLETIAFAHEIHFQLFKKRSWNHVYDSMDDLEYEELIDDVSIENLPIAILIDNTDGPRTIDAINICLLGQSTGTEVCIQQPRTPDDQADERIQGTSSLILRFSSCLREIFR